MTINASDHNDSWRKLQLTAIIPNSDPDAPIHLHAQTVIKGIPQPVIERDIDINSTAVTVISSTLTSPAVLIWQQHPPGYKEPKAQESVTQRKYPVTTQTPHHTTATTSPLPTNETPAKQHTLLHDVLASPHHHMPACMCMTVLHNMTFSPSYKAPSSTTCLSLNGAS